MLSLHLKSSTTYPETAPPGGITFPGTVKWMGDGTRDGRCGPVGRFVRASVPDKWKTVCRPGEALIMVLMVAV